MTTSSIRQLNQIAAPRLRVLFLGYDQKQSRLIDLLIDQRCEVYHTAQQLKDSTCDLIISFGYRHIINATTLDRLSCPAVNLHIAYLPFNKGSHPNFWSFYDQTPSGITIHLIDGGLDTGPILYQKYVNFNPEAMTFRQTQAGLKFEIEALFTKHLEDILNFNWSPKPQSSAGTRHKTCNLPVAFSGWDQNIADEMRRLKHAEGSD